MKATLDIQLKTYNKLLLYCTQELVNFVFEQFKKAGGDINIDATNEVIDSWEITDFVTNVTEANIEKFKVLMIFSKLSGELIYDGNSYFYPVICSIIKDKDAQKIQTISAHYDCSQMPAHYDLGNNDIPEIDVPYIIIRYFGTKCFIEKIDEDGEVCDIKTVEYESNEIAEQTRKELLDKYFG